MLEVMLIIVFFFYSYSPALKKWGYICFGFSVDPSVRSSIHHIFVSAQYLENILIEFNQFVFAFILT